MSEEYNFEGTSEGTEEGRIPLLLMEHVIEADFCPFALWHRYFDEVEFDHEILSKAGRGIPVHGVRDWANKMEISDSDKELSEVTGTYEMVQELLEDGLVETNEILVEDVFLYDRKRNIRSQIDGLMVDFEGKCAPFISVGGDPGTFYADQIIRISLAIAALRSAGIATDRGVLLRRTKDSGVTIERYFEYGEVAEWGYTRSVVAARKILKGIEPNAEYARVQNCKFCIWAGCAQRGRVSNTIRRVEPEEGPSYYEVEL